MDDLLFAASWGRQFWHLVPLIIIVSLVYGATRDEEWSPILEHAMRFGIWILGFLGLIFAILLFLSWRL